MRIAIRGAPVAHGTPRALAEQRLRLGLSRYSPRISGIQVHVDEAGLSRACRLTVRMESGWVVQVQDEDRELAVLLDRACERAARAIDRALHGRPRLEPSPA